MSCWQLAARGNQIEIVVDGADTLVGSEDLLPNWRARAVLIAVIVNERNDAATGAVPLHTAVVRRVQIALTGLNLGNHFALGAGRVCVPLLGDGRCRSSHKEEGENSEKEFHWKEDRYFGKP